MEGGGGSPSSRTLRQLNCTQATENNERCDHFLFMLPSSGVGLPTSSVNLIKIIPLKHDSRPAKLMINTNQHQTPIPA